MTYLKDTPPRKTETRARQYCGASLPRNEAPPGPRDYNKDKAMTVQERWLDIFHNRACTLSETDTADTYYKLAVATCTVQKTYLEIAKANVKDNVKTGAEAPEGPGPVIDMDVNDRARKISDICKLANGLSPEDYDPQKLQQRAARVAAEFKASFESRVK